MALVQVKQQNNNDVLTIPSGGVPAGATLFLACGKTNNRVVASAVDSRDPTGNVYSVDVTESTNNWAGSLVSCKLTTALQLGDTITITWSGTGSFSCIMAFYSDDDLTGVDKVAAAAGSDTAPDSGSTSALAQADEVVIGACIWRPSTNGENFTQGTGYTLGAEGNTSGSRTVSWEHKTVAATTAVNADGTIPASYDWSMLVATYKIAGAGGEQVFGSASMALSASITTAGKKTAYGASASPLTASIASAGKKTAYGAFDAALTASIATAGKKTAYGAADLPLSAGFSTSGARIVYASASLPLALDLATAGKRRAQGAASLTETLSITTAGKKVAHGAAALPLTLSFTTVGTALGSVTFGSASMPITFGVTTSGKRTAHGAAALPITLTSEISGKKRAYGATALALLASIVTVGTVTSADVQEALERAERKMNNAWRKMASRDIFGW